MWTGEEAGGDGSEGIQAFGGGELALRWSIGSSWCDYWRRLVHLAAHCAEDRSCHVSSAHQLFRLGMDGRTGRDGTVCPSPVSSLSGIMVGLLAAVHVGGSRPSSSCIIVLPDSDGYTHTHAAAAAPDRSTTWIHASVAGQKLLVERLMRSTSLAL